MHLDLLLQNKTVNFKGQTFTSTQARVSHHWEIPNSLNAGVLSIAELFPLPFGLNIFTSTLRRRGDLVNRRGMGGVELAVPAAVSSPVAATLEVLDKSLLSHPDTGCTAKSLRGALSPVSISIWCRPTGPIQCLSFRLRWKCGRQG